MNQYQDLTFDNFSNCGISVPLKLRKLKRPDPKERTMTVSKFTMKIVLKQASGALEDEKDASSNS